MKSLNRLEESTKQFAGKKKIFCAFLTLGYPDLSTTKKLILEFEAMGVDIIELGFPFSDPMADGPTIQYSSECALKKGVRLKNAFDLVSQLRREGCTIPIVFFTYINPVFSLGLKNFAHKAKQAGFDGVVIPDLPPEEETDFSKECRKINLAQVFLIAPTTESVRAAKISKASHGFIYYVSLRGVTGARKAVASDVAKNLKTLKQMTSKPVLIGFGVSSPEQACELSAISQGVIVGSAIVESIRKSGGKIKPVLDFVKSLVLAVKGS